MNIVTLTGNIGKDLELQTSNTGTSYLRFNLAVKDDFKKDVTNWIPCVCFGKTAELVDQYCSKGSKIGVIGSWNVNQSEKDGEKRTYHSVTVNRVEFLGSKNNSDGGKSSTKSVVEDDDDFPF